MGTYGNGESSCQNCPSGTFSATTQSASVDKCATCGLGTTTFPTATGITACSTCANANKPLPRSSQDADGPVLFCMWTCNAGYIRQIPSNPPNSTLDYLYGTAGYGTLQFDAMLQLYHRDTDYCCSGSLATTGKKLLGCSKTSDGVPTACPTISNALYYDDGTSAKLDRCNDWKCNFGFYRLGSYCASQPNCLSGTTYNRDAAGGYIVYPNGSYVCAPCSKCLPGSEPTTTCNRTHDTVCRLCNSTSYSVAGGKCGAVPLGYMPVVVQYSQMPNSQGRPATYSDGTPMTWSNFLRTYARCVASPYGTRYTPWRSDPCTKSVEDRLRCVNSTCPTECNPWNGTAGYYSSPYDPSACIQCQFNSALCLNTQYLSMATCGPTSFPQCVDCPALQVDNVDSWVNPRVQPFNSPYPCDMVCKSGYTKANSACTNCPLIPANAKPMDGSTNCSWVCMKGYILSAGACVTCPTPPSCAVGTYLGYSQSTDQCKTCCPCTSPASNIVFTTVGDYGPNTCRYACKGGYYAIGYDSYNNPMECAACSTPACDAGVTFFTACTFDADASCSVCDVCEQGFKTDTACTVLKNTACSQCDPALLPASANWNMECAWACASGYVLTNDTQCIACKRAADCKPSERFVTAAGCGDCASCDPLPTGRAYLGDGKCGTYALTCTARSYPRSSKATSTTDVILCPWACNAGYMAIPANESVGLAPFANTRGLTTTNPATVKLYHRESDACCKLAGVGQQLIGCTQTADGVMQTCTARANAHYVLIGNKTTRCDDFECNAGYAGQPCARGVAAQTTSQAATTSAASTTTTLAVTTQPAFTTEPATEEAFASLVQVQLPTTLTRLTASVLSQITKSIISQSNCVSPCRTIVLSITNATGGTTFCINGTCPGFNTARRMLLALQPIRINFGIITPTPLPADVVITPQLSGTPLVCSVNLNSAMDTETLKMLVQEPSTLIVYVQTHPQIIIAPPSSSGLVIGVVLGLLVAAGAGGIVFLIARKQAKTAIKAAMDANTIPIRITLRSRHAKRYA